MDAVSVGVELWFASGDLAAVAVVGVAVVQGALIQQLAMFTVSWLAAAVQRHVLGIASWCCYWLSGEAAGLCQGARGAALSRRPGARGCQGRR